MGEIGQRNVEPVSGRRGRSAPRCSSIVFFLLLLLCSSTHPALGCLRLEISSQYLPRTTFSQISLDSARASFTQNSGRPVYRAEQEQDLFLYHGSLDGFTSGEGYWILSSTANHYISDDSLLATIESWSILPHMVDAIYRDSVSPRKRVHVGRDHSWVEDRSLSFRCLDADPSRSAVYFHSSMGQQPSLSGFYLRRFVDSDPQTALYSKVKVFVEDRDDFLFRLPGASTWIIGEEPLQDSGRAYSRDSADHVGDLQSPWHFLAELPDGGYQWLEDSSAALWSCPPSSDEACTIYTVVQDHRSLHSLPTSHALYTMRNGLPSPSFGLGTGGIVQSSASQVFRQALDLGYRLFDLAREYHNEHFLGPLLAQRNLRGQVFLISKVWPTDFGFVPTTQAVLDSLHDLHTDYLDLFLLHWPECYPSIDWMHCETTQEPQVTWRTAYNVLEKMYAEGWLMSIGVSNFNLRLLEEEVLPQVSVLPHAVQNYATLGEMDVDVRRFCKRHNVLYQPYASMRNWKTLSTDIRLPLERASRELGSSPYEVVLHCMLQGGAVMIPRSMQYEHLAANIQVPGWTLSDAMLSQLGCKVDGPAKEEL